MESSEFIDYYEILEISPNANSGTVERMFRYLAKRYHPDNQDTGDRLRFHLILDARTPAAGVCGLARAAACIRNPSQKRSSWAVGVG